MNNLNKKSKVAFAKLMALLGDRTAITLQTSFYKHEVKFEIRPGEITLTQGVAKKYVLTVMEWWEADIFKKLEISFLCIDNRKAISGRNLLIFPRSFSYPVGEVFMEGMVVDGNVLTGSTSNFKYLVQRSNFHLKDILPGLFSAGIIILD